MKASRRFQQISAAVPSPAKKIALLRATAYSKAALVIEKAGLLPVLALPPHPHPFCQAADALAQAGLPPVLALPPHPAGHGAAFPSNPPAPWGWVKFSPWGEWVKVALPTGPDQCRFLSQFQTHFPNPLRARPRPQGGILLADRGGCRGYDTWSKRLWWAGGRLFFEDGCAFDSSQPSHYSILSLGAFLSPPR